MALRWTPAGRRGLWQVMRGRRQIAIATHGIALGVLCAAAAMAGAPPVTAQAPDSTRPGYSAAAVQFMQGMIAHHSQALAMVSLIADRSTRADMSLLGQRIAISQRDEIAMMRRWLVDHHEPVPDSAGHAAMMPGMQMGDVLMPGMLTPQQMAELAKATGPDFDRLFLAGMIRHHEGALVMVKELFATNGATQAPEVFRFASDVDADQRAEIKRMRGMLDALPATAGHP